MLRAISRITGEIDRILEGRTAGIWLYGSVAMDDYRPGWSDIDFAALTRGRITESQGERLLTLRQDMLKEEPGNPYYRSFEGIIADLDEYRSRSFSRLVYWGTSGQRITDRFAHDAFSLYELAECSYPVWGGSPWPFPAPGREELVRAVRDHYMAIRSFAAETDESLYSCGWLLDIARCIYTLRHNGVAAKTKAGTWALENHVFPDDASLKRTLEIRRDPLAYKDREDVRSWLKGLGPTVQRYADVLEKELEEPGTDPKP